jgi:hypothetical protein
VLKLKDLLKEELTDDDIKVGEVDVLKRNGERLSNVLSWVKRL